MAATLTPEQIEFLRRPIYAVVATTRPDGSPHQTVVWMDVDGGDVVFNTADHRSKTAHLRANPHASITVLDPEDGYRWVAVSGTVELTHEGADASIDALAKKYLDADSYPWRNPDERRVIVRIRPERVDSAGFGST